MTECAQARRAVLERLDFFFFFTLKLTNKTEKKILKGFERSSQSKFHSFAIRSSALCLSEQRRPKMNKTGMQGPCWSGHEVHTSLSLVLGLGDWNKDYLLLPSHLNYTLHEKCLSSVLESSVKIFNLKGLMPSASPLSVPCSYDNSSVTELCMLITSRASWFTKGFTKCYTKSVARKLHLLLPFLVFRALRPLSLAGGSWQNIPWKCHLIAVREQHRVGAFPPTPPGQVLQTCRLYLFVSGKSSVGKTVSFSSPCNATGESWSMNGVLHVLQDIG